MDYSYGYSGVVAEARSSDRAAFIRRTYAHLAGAILAFIGLEAVFVNAAKAYEVEMMGFLLATPYMWLVVLLAFWGASVVAQMMARSESSRTIQYCGLALYVVAEAVICLPLLYVAAFYSNKNGDPNIIATAGIMTLAVFGGLTISVFITRKDYSFLGPIISVCSMIALGVIIAACLFGFSLGLLFSFAMVALMAGIILYQTSQVMLSFRTDQHVAAALMLFASVATLFWYILRILLILNRSR